MKFKISYFYQIRFFKPYQIPFSTALYDPKWFHKNGRYYKDKNGVYNGLRCEPLHPEPGNEECLNCWSDHDPTKCTFIENYKKQLSEISFDEMLFYLTRTAENIKQIEGFKEEPEIILIVYETPDNKCSERDSIIELFANHGIELTEFKKEEWKD